jgi:hypothetical protein
MVMSKASTVSEYLDSLPTDRRSAVRTVRTMVKHNLPKGYQEMMNSGMITYAVPLSRYPTTYSGLPLCYVALAAQKNYCALYLMGCYSDPAQTAELKAAFKAAGKKLDMGKSCVRFKSAEDLPLDAIGKLIGSVPPDAFIARYEAARRK